MFGCCVAGRLLQTNLQQVDETHALFELSAASTINHICVFLLGTGKLNSSVAVNCLIVSNYSTVSRRLWGYCPFPLARQRIPAYGDVSSPYCRWLLILTHLLRLSNEKPSAIFRLRGSFTPHSSSTHTAFSSAPLSAPNVSDDVTAILGLSIEPLVQIQNQMSTLPSTVAKSRQDPMRDPTVLAERIVKHLFNYVSGFAGGGGVTPESVVPMSIIARWYDIFLSKVRAGGIGFLERGE